ncbi:Na(+)/H(+) antiporter subunit C [Rubripirellula tenax]|uniref:Na(+)/H(+) antiporter subunit C n=1 Tax=Rubripirellula tenax TaxID=2528015 RepID=A0A5C6FFY9_9BACT|nr:cation:proton antiporter subunit C [Rubripirellula tenax]TWU60686.1 Na(+)/H(+) antiporter subunit C [Rubripirellula tenax]
MILADTLETFRDLFNYWVVVFLMMTGFYIVIARKNLIKTIIGLNIFQTSVFLLYITMGKIDGATAPIIPPALAAGHGHGHDESSDAASHVAEQIYSNPLPSVLMLTAIVVGIATTATALALIVRIREDYGTIEEDEILELDRTEWDKAS